MVMPAPIAVTRPASSTRATEASPLSQKGVTPDTGAPLASTAVAVMVTSSPRLRSVTASGECPGHVEHCEAANCSSVSCAASAITIMLAPGPPDSVDAGPSTYRLYPAPVSGSVIASGPSSSQPTGRTKWKFDAGNWVHGAATLAPDGTLYVHFLNEQNQSGWQPADDFDDQVLVVRVNPDTFAVAGPYQVTMLADGLTNYPFNADGRQTVCNGGWRLNAAGNIAIGPSDELYVVWADNRNGDEFPYPTFLNPDGTCPDGLQTSTDVFISKSTDGGVTWSAAKKISKDPPNFDNWFPWVAVGKNGLVGVVYYDRRVSGDNTLTDAWVATSWKGNWWKEFRVSDKSSDFSTAFFGTPSFIGDYNGLAIAGLRLYPFWTDGRVAGDSDVFMDVVRPNDD